MTPGELSVYYRKRRAEELDRQKLTEYNNYTLATLVRAAVWGKKMPSFEDVFPEKKKNINAGVDAHRQMTDEEMFRQVQALNRLFGGTEE